MIERECYPFSDLLRGFRKRAGMSQQTLAHKLRKHRNTIAKWERGDYLPDTRSDVMEIVHALTLSQEDQADLLFAYHGYDATQLEKQNGHLVLMRDQKNQLSPPFSSHRASWGEAPEVRYIYGREHEIDLFKEWIITDQCKIVAILGIGGVGKTALATVLAKEIQTHFDALFWYSLSNTPPPETFLKAFLQFFAPEHEINLSSSLDELLAIFMQYMQKHHVLIVLDNAESILQAGRLSGHYRAQYEGYGLLFQRIGKMSHQSCLVLTSRELPKEIGLLEGETSLVRSYRLAGLEMSASEKLLAHKHLQGPTEAQHALISFYAGNPLALQLVTQFIREVYDGNIASYLEENQGVFHDVNEVIDQQFSRLSPSEQEIMYWLAIRRELASLQSLQAEIIPPKKREELVVVLRSLRRRSLIEQSNMYFNLQQVIMEFVTEKVIEQAYEAVIQGTRSLLHSHSLMQAQAQDYLRETQRRLILCPLSEKLCAAWGKEQTISHLLQMLADLRQAQVKVADRTAGNLINLLIELGYDFCGTDLSALRIEQAYLCGITLQDVNLAHAHLSRCVFSETFGPLRSLAWSPKNEILAVGTTTGEFYVWNVAEGTLLLAHRGHPGVIHSVAFNPTATMLATSGGDYSVRLWDIPSGRCLAIWLQHTAPVKSVRFSPDGKYVASGSYDEAIRLWEVQTGQCIKTFRGHTSWIQTVSFSPDGTMIASGALDDTIRIWDVQTGNCIQIIQAHDGVRTVAFHPGGKLLASGGGDCCVRLWEVGSWQCYATLTGHRHIVWTVAFHPDGYLLASGSEDQTVRVWDIDRKRVQNILQGHSFAISSVGFNAHGTLLASVGDDKVIRLWEIPDGQCRLVMQGYSQSIHSVAFSPDGTILATGNEDHTVQLWNRQTQSWLSPLRGHTHRVGVVRFSSDGKLLASASEDKTVRLWDVASRTCLQQFHGTTGLVGSLAFSPNNRYLASTSDGGIVHVWNIETRECMYFSCKGNVAFHPNGHLLAIGATIWDLNTSERVLSFEGHSGTIGEITFSPDGALFASCEDDMVPISHLKTQKTLFVLKGHTERVWSVAFHPQGTLLATASNDHTVRLWDLTTGQCLTVLQGHQSPVEAVTFSSDGQLLASGSMDGTSIFWSIPSGAPLTTLRSNRIYERLNIQGVSGLTEAQKAMFKALGAIEHALPSQDNCAPIRFHS